MAAAKPRAKAAENKPAVKPATIEMLRQVRTKVVEVEVDGSPVEFTIAKMKIGQRRRLRDECIDERGMLDLEQAARLAAEMCVVTPELSADDVEEIDLDVFLALADEIGTHSGATGDVQSAAALFGDEV